MLFELLYWSKLKLRHNLDVMHVEKNVFDTLVGTILDIEGKTKDTIKARLDLERMGIRRGLWMNMDSDKARRDLAFFSMKPNDKKEFLKFVSSVKFPDGYASNIARCVNVDEGKFTGLKSHDCHVFMKRLLPVGIRHLLPEDVVKPIMLLSRFFSQLTAKTLRKIDILQLRHDIVQVLCKFEMIFPPAFFTSMMHVMVHLPQEALLAGPVNYRWMYPIERLLGELKKSISENFFSPSLSPPSAQPPAPVDLDRAATTVVPRSFPAVTVEPAAAISSVFTESAPPSFSLLRRPNPTPEMSDLIRRRRAVTTTQSLERPTQPTSTATAPASAATAPALMNHLAVGPAGSQAPASSASSVAQPVSARRRHRPASTTDTTSTDASGSQPVAYKLQLPTGCKIHPVFHVSCLKKHLGTYVTPSLTLPRITEDGIVQDEPLAILERKLVKRGNAARVDVLVHWKGHTPEDATWKDYHDLQARFPELIAQVEAAFNSR
ncbi:hypothetical protein L3X38_011860 [Prunus dulcis]|uniref:Chromo domain-containing protein n=1 Tax=Prunus dulcis TaxID=3755 RepID=A0AAD4WI64_PRUDU|nr:hypothetical protein L3X38_011860 [Prunus dulcis]